MNAGINGIGRALDNQGGRFNALRPVLISFLAALLFSPLSQAQHEMHNMSTTGDGYVTTMPENDEVLAAAPESIMLHFGSEVRLVNLALREPSQGKEIIDIGFRFRPEAAMHFAQALPELAAADYYVVDWAAFGADGRLVKGSFNFSFGPDARPPSSYRGQMDHRMDIMSPDYRLQ